MNTIASTNLPAPHADVTVRAATLDDLPDVDRLQKAHSKSLGFLHRATLRGKVRRGEMLVAHAVGGGFAGYVVGSDCYHKRQEVGVVYQMAVAESHRRGTVGATLLQKLFESWAYGTRLCSAWCAQDLPANRFWEAMGFVPLAYRAGSVGKRRVHVFWQRRVVDGDAQTPWWYPSSTGGGAIREDRLVLPIPEGQHWSEARPQVLPTLSAEDDGDEGESVEADGTVEADVEPVGRWPVGVEERDGELYEGGKRLVTVEMARREQGAGPGGLFMVPPDAKIVRALPTPNAARAKRKSAKTRRAKHDPRLASAVRELRDRWLEHVNEAGRLLPSPQYAVGRAKALPGPGRLVLPLPTGRLLSAA